MRIAVEGWSRLGTSLLVLCSCADPSCQLVVESDPTSPSAELGPPFMDVYMKAADPLIINNY